MEIIEPDYAQQAIDRAAAGEDLDTVWNTTPRRDLTAADIGLQEDGGALEPEALHNYAAAESQRWLCDGEPEPEWRQHKQGELPDGPHPLEQEDNPRWLEDHERFLDRLDQLGPAAYDEPELDEPAGGDLVREESRRLALEAEDDREAFEDERLDQELEIEL